MSPSCHNLLLPFSFFSSFLIYTSFLFLFYLLLIKQTVKDLTKAMIITVIIYLMLTHTHTHISLLKVVHSFLRKQLFQGTSTVSNDHKRISSIFSFQSGEGYILTVDSEDTTHTTLYTHTKLYKIKDNSCTQ